MTDCTLFTHEWTQVVDKVWLATKVYGIELEKNELSNTNSFYETVEYLCLLALFTY